eukprot:1307139-Rhodomonas_salina.4
MCRSQIVLLEEGHERLQERVIVQQQHPVVHANHVDDHIVIILCQGEAEGERGDCSRSEVPTPRRVDRLLQDVVTCSDNSAVVLTACQLAKRGMPDFVRALGGGFRTEIGAGGAQQQVCPDGRDSSGVQVTQLKLVLQLPPDATRQAA